MFFRYCIVLADLGCFSLRRGFSDSGNDLSQPAAICQSDMGLGVSQGAACAALLAALVCASMK